MMTTAEELEQLRKEERNHDLIDPENTLSKKDWIASITIKVDLSNMTEQEAIDSAPDWLRDELDKRIDEFDLEEM